MNPTIDKKDLQLITQLRLNARMPLTKMSRKTQIPISTLFDRLRMNESNVIIKHTSLLNFAMLGYNTRATIALKVPREERDKLKDFLLKHHAVNSVYRVNNGFDFMIEGIFKDVREVEDFRDVLDSRFSIKDIQYFLIIEDLKREEFLSDMQWMV